MERFRPDSFWEALLRPLLMADPEGGLYLEVAAPDLRFLFLLGALFFLIASRRFGRLSSVQIRAVLSLLLCLYAWTFLSGNGRYFLPGLVLVGPLLAVSLLSLPGSKSLRGFLLLTAIALQTAVTLNFLRPAPWAIAWVKEGINLPIVESPLRTRPGVFFSLGGNSHSALVPLFDPMSRWTNVAGHYRPPVGGREDRRLQELVDSALPKFAVIPMKVTAISTTGQPTERARLSISPLFLPVGLAFSAKPCETLVFEPSEDSSERSTVDYGDIKGFWLCPLERASAEGVLRSVTVPLRYREALEAIEATCPRFFPSGGGHDEYANEIFVRHYSGSDTQLRIYPDESMYYGYYRAFAATKIGNLNEIADGRLSVPCKKLAGRYQVPWLRE